MRILSTRVLLLAVVFMSSQPLMAYTLDDAVLATLQNHPEIKSTSFSARAAAQDVLEARGSLLPSLNVGAGIGREHSDNSATQSTGRGSRTFTRRESEIFMQQLLFDGGNVRGVLKQRRFSHEAAVHRVAETKERLGFDAVLAYHDVLFNRELVEIRRLDVNAHHDMLKRVKRRMDAGAGRRSEIDLADSRLALSQARLSSAKGDLNNTYDNFIKVVGVSVPTLLEPPHAPKELPKNVIDAQQRGVLNNPSIQVLAANAKSEEAEIGVAQSAFYPTFTLDLRSTYNNNLDGVTGSNDERQAMVRMNYNLFNGGSDLAAVRAAKNRKKSANEDLANTVRVVKEGVAIAWNDLQTANARINHLKRHRDESLAVYNAYVKQFQLGQRTLFDLLNAQTEYFDARTNYVSGIYEIKVSQYRVLANMGTLTSYFNST